MPLAGPGRQQALLRPPPRGRPHRLGPRRPAATRSGRPCSARCAAGPTPPATTATPSRRSTAARTARTSAWRSSASTSPRKGLGLHNDLQNESSIVGNNVGLLLMLALRHARSRRPSGSTAARRHERLRVRHHRAGPRLRRHPHGDHRGPRRRRPGSSTARRPGTPASTRRPTT